MDKLSRLQRQSKNLMSKHEHLYNFLDFINFPLVYLRELDYNVRESIDCRDFDGELYECKNY